MRLRHIEVFHAVYTSGSITQAARLLNVSQPSVSKVLAHAELQVGFALFNRTKGKLTPTPEAERLFKHVLPVFDNLSSVKRVAGNLREAAAGNIRLASTPALGIALVPRLIAAFLRTTPDAYFEVETLHIDEIVDGLRESRIDIALAFDPPPLPDMQTTQLAEGRFVVIAPNRLAAQLGSRTALADLAGMPFVRLNTRGPLGQLLDAHLSDAGAAPDPVAATETYHLAHALVAEGVGVAIVDEVTATSSSSDGVKIIELAPPIGFTVAALQLESPALPRLTQRFLEFSSANLAGYMRSDPPV